MKTVKIKFLPENKILEVLSGTTLIQASEKAGIIIALPCGGKKRCGKCKVEVKKGKFPVSKFEKDLLNIEELKQGIRLACCCNIITDSDILIPDSVRLYPREILAYSPLDINKKKFKFSPLIDKLIGKKLKFKKRFGLGFDLGTTNISAGLIDLSSGKEVLILQSENPQSKFGSDIISRLEFIKHKTENLDKLHKSLVYKINDIINKFLYKQGISLEHIEHIVCAGNTFMQYVLMNTYPKGLLNIPFRSEFKKTVNKSAKSLGLNLSSNALLTVIPGIGGFIGSDISSVILSSGIYRKKGINLVVDLGTNGEIVLANSGKLVAASCACGPALEGIHISSGMRAVPGAIESFNWDKDNLSYTVIDGLKPRGICGTGLIDLIAYLKENGKIKLNGYLEKSSFNVTDKIKVTQKDIRQFQLAKAAIRAGINILLDKHNIDINRVDEVMIAGNFGNFANPDNMIKSTFLPEQFHGKIKFIGNAALVGVNMVLCSSAAFLTIEEIARNTKFINIAENKDFQDKFADAIGF